jgi:hypothetical protein
MLNAFTRLYHFVSVLFFGFISYSASADTLSQQTFLNPSAQYLPKTWMHAMNGNISKPGLSEDFKAMNKAGVGGAIFFHVHRRNVPYSSRGPVRFGTDEFFEHLLHAAAEAEKNDIEFGIHNSDGWTSSGGPWITPELSMKRITWSEHAVSGGQTYVPPQPGYYENYYKDLAVIAIPANRYNQSNAFTSAKITVSDPSLDSSVLKDSDWDNTLVFTKNTADEYWVQVEVEEPTTLRSLHIETPNRHGDAALQISDDGRNFTTVVEKLRRPRPGARLWAFSPQLVNDQQDGFTAKFFRLVFTKPITIKRFDLWSIPRTNDWFSMNAMERGRLSMAPNVPSDAIIAFDDVRVLNRGNVPKEGIKLPKGNWRILRFGYTSTGAFNVPATIEGEGLEVDKFDPKALQFHFEQYVGKLVKEAQSKGNNGFKTTEIDSYEVGGQNWTQDLNDSFEKQFGYDVIPWLPTLTGRVVTSPEYTGSVLHEFRHHLSDLMVENYFGEFARLSTQYGLESYIEPYGWGPFDELASGGKADRLMGEFWVKAPFGQKQYYHGRVDAAISSGHVYGKNIISAESFTSTGTNWYGHPYFYKHHGDNMWTLGINETMFHRFAHQPNNHVKPGMTMDSIGSHIDRTQTWWGNGGVKWFEYLARGSYLLQQGVPDADFLVHLGDMAPLRVTKHRYVPEGYNFDHVNTDVLINRASVKDGYIVLPEGTRYRALVLTNTKHMQFSTLQRVEELVAAGATVIGEKPERIIGFSEWVRQMEFTQLANALWGDSKKTLKTYKKGRISSLNLEDSIEQLGIEADLLVDGKPIKSFAKRRLGDNTLYYFHNDREEVREVKVDIRDGDGIVEIWNVDDGSIEQVTRVTHNDKRVLFSQQLEPYGGRFVLIRRDNQVPDYNGKHAQLVKDIYFSQAKPSITSELKGPWKVKFDPEWSGPGEVSFEKLIDWTEHADEGIKYFSGTAQYSSSFTLSPEQVEGDTPLYLDLGEVKYIAEVSVNGKAIATLWKPPFAVDISAFVQDGHNTVDIAVTNTWVNRLIGDEALPDTSGYKMTGDTVPWLTANEKPPESERVTFTGFNFFKKKQHLQSSGLLGPVRIVKVN